MISALLLFALASPVEPPPEFVQMIRPIMQDMEAATTRTDEFMQQEYGRELGPLFVDVQSFIEAGRQVSGPDFDRGNVEAAIKIPFRDATYEDVVCHAPQRHPPDVGENHWIQDNGFFVQIDSVIPTAVGYDLLVTTATTEYRPADEYRPIASSALSVGQARYSFAREGDDWVLNGREQVWTS